VFCWPEFLRPCFFAFEEERMPDGDLTQFVRPWLQHAPKPPSRGANLYDAFISYRSSDRAWAMALYDVLKLAGWEPFLDQYDLVPGANLETSLSEGLEATSAGVILWSSRTKDSDWCKGERNAMRTLAGRPNSAFKYVFTKLDAEELPLFAQADLYVGFEESPEGPRGVNLLRLMCGIRGIALPPEAVVMAQQVDVDAKQAMAQINGAIEAGNAAKLLEIGTSDHPGLLASPGPILAVAQGLIRLGKYDDARTVLKRALLLFAQSVRARQLEGLALRRLKKYQEAVDVLSELKAAGHQDPETLGILAAARYGLFQETGKMLHLRNARELYRTAFTADPKDYYTGINAASKSLFLGEPAEAARLAGEVLPLVKNATDGKDLYAGCTLGEVYLLQGKVDEAVAQYQKVIDNHPNAAGDLKGTGEQAELICASLKLSPEDTAKVMAPFKLLD
jgi:tetratricopeptide (TPR) repeat protein